MWESAQQDLKSKLQTALKEGVELLERVQLLEEKSLLKDAERAQLYEVRNHLRLTSTPTIDLNQHKSKAETGSIRDILQSPVMCCVFAQQV
jgi:hypothetical protein